MIIPPARADFMRKKGKSQNNHLKRSRSHSRPKSEVGHYNQYDEDSEYYNLHDGRSRSCLNLPTQSKHNAMENFNEETYKMTNHLLQTMPRRRNSENSRYDSRLGLYWNRFMWYCCNDSYFWKCSVTTWIINTTPNLLGVLYSPIRFLALQYTRWSFLQLVPVSWGKEEKAAQVMIQNQKITILSVAEVVDVRFRDHDRNTMQSAIIMKIHTK